MARTSSTFKALGYRVLALIDRKRKQPDPQLMEEAKRADEVMFRATSIFPLMLFPDTMTIDRVKVTITNRLFFATAQVSSISYEDLMNVEATVGPFFGSLKLWSQVFTERAAEVTKPMKIDFLTRKNTMEAERILQGFIIAKYRRINTDPIPKTQLLPLLKKLGQDGSTQSS